MVKTKAPQNRNAVFQYRVPNGYDKNRREMYRVLVIFGGRNTDGKADASGRMGWGKWCDDNGIFLVAPGLKDDNYWEPEAWSGRALQKALRQLKQKYNICTDKILYYGYSAGSQASNLLPCVGKSRLRRISRADRKNERYSRLGNLRRCRSGTLYHQPQLCRTSLSRFQIQKR